MIPSIIRIPITRAAARCRCNAEARAWRVVLAPARPALPAELVPAMCARHVLTPTVLLDGCLALWTAADGPRAEEPLVQCAVMFMVPVLPLLEFATRGAGMSRAVLRAEVEPAAIAMHRVGPAAAPLDRGAGRAGHVPGVVRQGPQSAILRQPVRSVVAKQLLSSGIIGRLVAPRGQAGEALRADLVRGNLVAQVGTEARGAVSMRAPAAARQLGQLGQRHVVEADRAGCCGRSRGCCGRSRSRSRS